MRKNLYLILAIIGFVIPYYYFVSFTIENGLNLRIFFEQLFGTPISSFFAVDLLISSVVFVHYLRQEATRFSIVNWWVYVGVLLMVGLSCALPLFLYARESRIERLEKS